jgi:hypothetical protein
MINSIYNEVLKKFIDDGARESDCILVIDSYKNEIGIVCLYDPKISEHYEVKEHKICVPVERIDELDKELVAI